MSLIQNDSIVLKQAIKKSIARLLPFLALMYILAFLDRANIGFAHHAFLIGVLGS